MAKVNKARHYTFPEFNLNIKSEISLSLPLLKVKPLHTDIEIIKNKSISVPNGTNSFGNCFGDQSAYFYLKEHLFIAKICEGKKIFVQLLSDIDEEVLSNMVLNIPLGYCLYQKSKFVLHGSGFKKENNTVLFLGESGSGKSSLVASLMDSGEVLSEDLCYVDFDKNSNSLVNPFLPFIKLEKESNLGFKDNFVNIIDIPHDKRKRAYYYFQKGNPRFKSKIKCIYLLKWGDKFKIYKPEIKELFSFLNLCAFTCYPLNSCANSSKQLFENITQLSKNTNFFVLERSKDELFANNSALLEHISDCPEFI